MLSLGYQKAEGFLKILLENTGRGLSEIFFSGWGSTRKNGQPLIFFAMTILRLG